MSVVAPAPAAPRRPRKAAPKPKPQARPAKRTREAPLARPRRRSPVFPGVAWVLLIAALFGGIVALNVGALRSSIDASRLDAEGAALRTQNADLAARVAALSGYGRISKMARELGMVQARPTRKDFITLRLSGHADRGTAAAASRSQTRRGQGASPAR